jgi:polyhydroxybutyrate depolymerase
MVASAIVALLFASACSSTPSGTTPGDTATAAEPSSGCAGSGSPALHNSRVTLEVAGGAREYLIDAPASEADQPRPLILAFHGFSSNAEDQCGGTGLRALGEREHTIVVCPEGRPDARLLNTVGRGWDINPGETRDVDFVTALLDHLERERCVDRRRIYVTGMSNGGLFSSLLGCRLAERLAAIAPVAGVMPLQACAPARPVAALLMFGRADRIVPTALTHAGRDWWLRIDGCGAAQEVDGCTSYAGCRADVVVCEGPQKHRWPEDATERIWRFFTAHLRP